MGISLVVRLVGPIPDIIQDRYDAILDTSLSTPDGPILNSNTISTFVASNSSMIEVTTALGISRNISVDPITATPNIINEIITWTVDTPGGIVSNSAFGSLVVTPPPGTNTPTISGAVTFRNETTTDPFGTNTKLSYSFVSATTIGNSGNTPLLPGQESEPALIGMDLIATSLCVHEDSQVHIRTHDKQDIFVSIKDLKIDPNIRLIGTNNEEIELLYNLKCLPVTDFTLYSKDCFGEGSPSQDLYISGGHPILLNAEEKLPRDLINNTTIRTVTLEPTPIYTLCTKERTFVMINNVAVCTWKREDLEKTIAKQISEAFIKQ
jgi:hypothetical protein